MLDVELPAAGAEGIGVRCKDVVRTPEEMRGACRELKAGAAGQLARELGFVPTMGALHAGHMSLVEAARRECEVVVASIFVNPTQFGPSEDFEAYPRTLEEDCAQLEAAGVEWCLRLRRRRCIRRGRRRMWMWGSLATRLDGASRPGHFRGVATIVARLL